VLKLLFREIEKLEDLEDGIDIVDLDIQVIFFNQD